MSNFLFLTNSKFKLALLSIIIATLVACAGSDDRYLDSKLDEKLILPPDMTNFSGRSNFKLPAGFSADDPLARRSVPVLAKVKSLRLEGSADFYWLSAQAPVKKLYKLTKDFWAHEGYALESDEPVIGIMKTEWVLTEQGDNSKGDGFWASLFYTNEFSATQDQFKTRIERAKNKRSRIYISHQGTEYNYKLLKGKAKMTSTEKTEWIYRRSEPALEIEMLSRLMIYLGLKQADVQFQLENAKLFKARASMHLDTDENAPYLLLNDPYPVAWNRVYHQLERLNFEIERSDKVGGVLGNGQIVVKTELVDEASSGFFSIFASDEVQYKKIYIMLSQQSNKTAKLLLETSNGKLDSSPEAAKFLDLLFQNLK